MAHKGKVLPGTNFEKWFLAIRKPFNLAFFSVLKREKKIVLPPWSFNKLKIKKKIEVLNLHEYSAY